MTIGVDIGISATKVAVLNGTTASCLEIWDEPFKPERLEKYIATNIPNKSIDTETNQVMSVPTPVIGRRCDIVSWHKGTRLQKSR